MLTPTFDLIRFAFAYRALWFAVATATLTSLAPPPSFAQLATAAELYGSRIQETADADDEAPSLSAAEQLSQALKRELSKSYPGARIELTGPARMASGALPGEFAGIVSRGESMRGGELSFSVIDAASGRETKGSVPFAAWVPARIAVKRVLPGQKLADDQFKVQDVNVAAGMAREYRGVILEPEAALARIEARQTILEGQFLVSSAVQRMPDVRRGDAVRVQVISGALSLSTQGSAQEPAYLDGQVRVMTGKNKRELVGKLLENGVVEVKL